MLERWSLSLEERIRCWNGFGSLETPFLYSAAYCHSSICPGSVFGTDDRRLLQQNATKCYLRKL